MFELFNDDKYKRGDVKSVRDSILRFVKQELQKSEGGEGHNIKDLQLFIICPGEERHIYEAAAYVENPALLKQEIQKIADDFAIDLSAGWALEIMFTDHAPLEAIQSNNLHLALAVRTKHELLSKNLGACIKVLHGEAEKGEYIIHSKGNKITIGRENNAQVSEGFFRVNTIAFPGDSTNEANKYISRQHAHISWNAERGLFMIYADEGGVPPHNKLKIKSVSDDIAFKLNSTQIGHALQEGDQIILGDSAVMEFRYLTENKPNE